MHVDWALCLDRLSHGQNFRFGMWRGSDGNSNPSNTVDSSIWDKTVRNMGLGVNLIVMQAIYDSPNNEQGMSCGAGSWFLSWMESGVLVIAAWRAAHTNKYATIVSSQTLREEEHLHSVI